MQRCLSVENTLGQLGRELSIKPDSRILVIGEADFLLDRIKRAYTILLKLDS